MNAAKPASPWFSPRRHADRRGRLLARSRILTELRAWFDGEGFCEVECDILQTSPGNETHLHGFSTERIGLDGSRTRLFLQTSPEFAMKKLLAAGEERIFEFARVFRNREAGPLHANEFTMLEWYRAGAPLAAIMADCGRILEIAARAAGTGNFAWRGRICDPAAAPERLSVAEAFRRHAGIDLLATLPGGRADGAALAEAARGIGLRIADDDGWTDVFSRLLVDRIEPNLGIGRATILCDYPIVEAALARPNPDDPRLAERFELYVCGVELANAFAELTDPVEQRLRFEADMRERLRIYGDSYPIDPEFLAALATMPEASGAALGFDRLVVLATGAPDIAAVRWTAAAEGTPLP
jgi:lysyl-tRNA synthetase class 2